MPSRYMTTQRERKLPASPKKAVGGVGGKVPTPKSAGSGFPTCYGSGGTFGPFQRKATR